MNFLSFFMIPVIILVSTFQVFPQSWVANVSPYPNAININDSTSITITFTQDINPATLTNTTIRVNGSQSSWHVSSNISYQSSTKTAAFIPDTPFMDGETVDIVITTGVQNNAGVSMPAPYSWSFTVQAESGSGSFLAGNTTEIGDAPYRMTSGDWDNDGDLDVAITLFNGSVTEKIAIFLNDGTSNMSKDTVFTLNSAPLELAPGDFDSDGDLDIVATNLMNTISLLTNDGTGHFSVSSIPVPLSYQSDVKVKDFDGDGDLDLTIVSDQVYLLKNNGSGVFTPILIPNIEGELFVSTSADFDNDGDYDLALSQLYSDSLLILSNDGGGNFTLFSVIQLGPAVEIVTGDINSDGNMDLLIPNTQTTQLSVLLNNGNAVFSQSSLQIGIIARWVNATDYDADGDLDLAVAHDKIQIFQNDGNGNFNQAGQYSYGAHLRGQLISADLNGDGDMDLADGTHYLGTYKLVIFNNKDLVQNIAVQPLRLNFGITKTDSTKRKTFYIYNQGTGQNLEINTIISSNQAFSVNPNSATIAPGDSLSFTVLFTPIHASGYRDSLIIYCNDPDTPHLIIPVTGFGYPISSTFPGQNSIHVSPDSNIVINFTLPLDPTSLNNFTVKASGSQSGLNPSSNITYNSVTGELVYDPDFDFFPGEKVTFILTSDIQTSSGDTLPAAFNLNYTISSLNSTASFRDGAPSFIGLNNRGILSSDFDNDGDLDIAVREFDRIHILKNDGSGNLSKTLTILTGVNEYIQSMLPVDFDLDNDMDILIIRGSYTPQVVLFSNDGSGNFSESLALNLLSDLRKMVNIDLNADGYPDFVLYNSFYNSSKILKLFNLTGNGMSQELVPVSGFKINMLKTGDFNNDGAADLVSINILPSNTLTVLQNDGIGNFYPIHFIPVFHRPQSVKAADVNNDSYLDLVVSYPTSSTISVHRNDGNANFVNVSSFDAGAQVRFIKMGDMDGDGDLDLIAVTQKLNLFLNDGNGNYSLFGSITQKNTHIYTKLSNGDFDNDGDLDIAAINMQNANFILFFNRNSHIQLNLSTAALHFGVVKKDSIDTKSFQIYNDGFNLNLQITDIITTNPAYTVSPLNGTVPPGDSLTVTVNFSPPQTGNYGDSLLIYSNDPLQPSIILPLMGAGYPLISVNPTVNQLNVNKQNDISVIFSEDMHPASFTNQTIRVHGSQSGLHVSGDITYNSATKEILFNPDNDFIPGEEMRVILTSEIENAQNEAMPAPLQWDFRISTAPDSGGFAGLTHAGDFNTVNAPNYMVTGDFNNDQYLDLAITDDNINRVALLMNDGNGNFIQTATTNVGNKPSNLVTSDFNGDGYQDLAVSNVNSNDVSILLNDATGNFTQYATIPVDDSPVSLTSGDFDRDWDLDLGVSGNSMHPVSILSNDGNSNFLLSQLLLPPLKTWGIVSGDFNNDTNQDLAVVNTDADSVHILLNNDQGQFHSEFTFAVGSYPRALALADLDRDGDLDLALSHFSIDTLNIYTNDGTGLFSSHNAVYTGTKYYHSDWGDVDGDGDPDLVIVNTLRDSIYVMANNGSAFFNRIASYPVGHKPVSVTLGDFDTDGDLDVVTVNRQGGTVTLLKNKRIVNIEGISPTLPDRFALYQNYPNPFNPSTTIRYDVPVSSRVILKIYNILGQTVKTLLNTHQSSGHKKVKWDGTNDAGQQVSSGIYIYTIKAGSFHSKKKMILLR